ncbi:hypothetical protein CYLTODRAFT_412931 [Cylindrobasidium torrendii FP15055 ss-10]|uniref:Uncharacterized protein n=1 Tax=Cylindrobasidium torrendii FP15055 ss-10 TaxID=1314674 RepID=A0A0D7B635_9AGAR|nr:hypothetical protein CYLTODRAFT_412931 [Cylindrobasidium torrendii FP15055 ss-10]
MASGSNVTVSEQMGLSAQEVYDYLDGKLNGGILAVMAYALYSSVFLISLYYILTANRADSTWYRRVDLTLLTCMWIFATVQANPTLVAYEWRFVQSIFIVHADTRESSFDFSSSDHLEAFNTAQQILKQVNILLADWISIWRCWIIWGKSWKVLVLPVLCVTTNIVTWAFSFAQGLIPSTSRFVSLSSINWIVVYYSMTVFTNSVCTVLIIYRIIHISGTVALRTYRGVVEVLVESSVIYTLPYIIFLITYARSYYDANQGNMAYIYPRALLTAVTGIAPALIMLRVYTGHSRKDSEWPSNSNVPPGAFSSLHFQNTYVEGANISMRSFTETCHSTNTTPTTTPTTRQFTVAL